MSGNAKPQKENKTKEYTHSESFVKNIYLGKIEPVQVFPYPNPLTQEQLDTVAMLADPFEKFFNVSFFMSVIKNYLSFMIKPLYL